MPSARTNYRLVARWIFAIGVLIFDLVFLIVPALRLVADLNDSALTSGQIPRAAWRLHHHLAPLYATWARGRIAAESGAKLGDDDVAGTEWPLFGSVFFLWSEESLQQEWKSGGASGQADPTIYAGPAIEASVDLVMDPNQAAWVKQYWGKDYLHRQDLFYRFLQISAMTSYTRLTGNPRYVPQLRDQVETLSAEIDASPNGLLDDYPGQCFPTDVIGAITAIHRADQVLKTDHSAFVQRALRAFQPPHTDIHKLPAYNAVARTGSPLYPSRGCGDSFAFICAPELWPAVSQTWYETYVENFWQRSDGLVGFREFSKDTPSGMAFMDVDSGPVLLGFGFAASAFGVGTARAQGRMDQAGPLAAEMLVSSWPAIDGTLVLPYLLSDATDAPYLGEAGILFSLTRQPVLGIQKPGASVMTPFVWGIMILYAGFSILFALPLVQLCFRRRRAN